MKIMQSIETWGEELDWFKVFLLDIQYIIMFYTVFEKFCTKAFKITWINFLRKIDMVGTDGILNFVERPGLISNTNVYVFSENLRR